jgi:putative flippase GtrA
MTEYDGPLGLPGTAARRSAAPPFARPTGPTTLLLQSQFLRFLAIGLVNTAFGYAVFFLVFELSRRTLLALVVSTVVGVAFNFFSIGAVVFQSTDKRRLWRFVGAYGAVFAVNAATMRALEALGIDPVLAQAFLTPCLAILAYVLNRNYVFNDGRIGEQSKCPKPSCTAPSETASQARSVPIKAYGRNSD